MFSSCAWDKVMFSINSNSYYPWLCKMDHQSFCSKWHTWLMAGSELKVKPVWLPKTFLLHISSRKGIFDSLSANLFLVLRTEYDTKYSKIYVEWMHEWCCIVSHFFPSLPQTCLPQGKYLINSPTLGANHDKGVGICLLTPEKILTM